MKFAIVILAVVATASAQQSGKYNPYRPFNTFTRAPAPVYRPTYKPFTFTTPAPPRYISPTYAPSTIAPPVVPRITIAPVSPIYSNNRDAQTLKYGNEINPDGSFNYFFETSNGIAAQENGVPRNFGGNPPVVPVVTQGSFSWTSDDGVPIQITYTADENGYQPQGNAIPTPPPVPPQIARALEYIARNAPRN